MQLALQRRSSVYSSQNGTRAPVPILCLLVTECNMRSSADPLFTRHRMQHALQRRSSVYSSQNATRAPAPILCLLVTECNTRSRRAARAPHPPTLARLLLRARPLGVRPGSSCCWSSPAWPSRPRCSSCSRQSASWDPQPWSGRLRSSHPEARRCVRHVRMYACVCMHAYACMCVHLPRIYQACPRGAAVRSCTSAHIPGSLP